MHFKVLVLDNVHEKGLEILARREGFQLDVKPTLEPSALKDIISEYDAIIIRSGTKMKADVIQAAPNLKVIVRAGAGLDNVDVPDATRRGIAVMNTPGGNSVATAEHTIAMIMAAHRHIPQADSSMKAGKWDKKKFQGREIAGRTLGVIGLGRVGGIVARLASQGLKMKVLGYDPAVTPEAVSQMGAEYEALDGIFSRSDVITVHTPLNEDTRNLLNVQAFDKMKNGVVVVNCARGGIIDDGALLQALETGKVAAAALDVFSVQPPGENALVRHPRVIATPHLGASTTEAQINVAVAAAEQIIDYLERGIVRNAVNVPTLGPSEIAKASPYINLARRLAQFLAGLGPAGATEIKEMEIQYVGEVLSWDLKPITNAALLGLVSRFTEDANLVNAATILQERGIRLSVTTLSKDVDLASSILIRTLYADGTSRTVRGAVLRSVENEPRIIGIDEFRTEAVPAGPMLVSTNRDIPGMIAGISGALAARGINIAQMNLSRDYSGGKALSIINIDQPADEATLDSIRNINGVLSVRQVILDS